MSDAGGGATTAATLATSDHRIVAYLDFDGTVTTHRLCQAMGGPALNPYVCGDLADAFRAHDVVFVVSSTWRMDGDCRARMAAAGLPMDRLHADWRTAPIPSDGVDFATGDVVKAARPTRQDEVEDHVRRNGVTRYVVLDDDASIGGDPARWQVRPDADRGLGPSDLDRLNDLLDRLGRVAPGGRPG